MNDARLMLGDCLELMKALPDGSVDAVITDPPYPGLAGGLARHPELSITTFTVSTPWGENLDALKEFRRVARYGALVFCSWHAIGEVRDLLGGNAVGLVTWHKRNAQPSFRNRPHHTCEHVWLIEYALGMNWKQVKTFYDIPLLQGGCMATERLVDKSGKTIHPTQKPLALMKKLIEAVPVGGTVLDPFMGSGTTGVACMQLGRNFLGMEIDPTYFAVAQKRIEAARAQLHLDFSQVDHTGEIIRP